MQRSLDRIAFPDGYFCMRGKKRSRPRKEGKKRRKDQRRRANNPRRRRKRLPSFYGGRGKGKGESMICGKKGKRKKISAFNASSATLPGAHLSKKEKKRKGDQELTSVLGGKVKKEIFFFLI